MFSGFFTDLKLSQISDVVLDFWIAGIFHFNYTFLFLDSKNEE